MYGKASGYYPYFEAYDGHLFEVEGTHNNDHLRLKCVTGLKKEGSDDPLVIAGHFDEVVYVSRKALKQKPKTNHANSNRPARRRHQ